MAYNKEQLIQLLANPNLPDEQGLAAMRAEVPEFQGLDDQTARTQYTAWRNRAREVSKPANLASGGAPAVPQGSWWDEFVTGARRGSAEPVHVAGNLVNALAGVPAAQPIYDLEKSLRAPSKTPSNWLGETLPSAAMYGAPWLGGPVAGVAGDAAIAGIGALDRGLDKGIEASLLAGLTARFGPKALKALLPTRLAKAMASGPIKDLPARLARAWYQMPAKFTGDPLAARALSASEKAAADAYRASRGSSGNMLEEMFMPNPIAAAPASAANALIPGGQSITASGIPTASLGPVTSRTVEAGKTVVKPPSWIPTPVATTKAPPAAAAPVINTPGIDSTITDLLTQAGIPMHKLLAMSPAEQQALLQPLLNSLRGMSGAF